MCLFVLPYWFGELCVCVAIGNGKSAICSIAPFLLVLLGNLVSLLSHGMQVPIYIQMKYSQCSETLRAGLAIESATAAYLVGIRLPT